MKYLLIISLICSFFVASGQTWHSIKEHLKYHTPIGLHGYVAGIGNVDRYDSAFVVYRLTGRMWECAGYKYVFVHNGQLIDNKYTYKVIYDEYFRRIANVEKYRFADIDSLPHYLLLKTQP